MKTVNWAMLHGKYKELWVALDKDNETVVGAGTTPQRALDEAKAKGFEQAAITFIPQENGIMALVRMLRGGQVTLPAEARKALKLNIGDYLDLEVTGGVVTLKPVTVIDRAEANRQLDDILSRVTYIGPQPSPSEEEVMDMVVDEIRATRANQAKTRLCRYYAPRKA